MFQGIRHIIFDLGGVILNIDYHQPVQEFRKLGIPEPELMYSQQTQNHLFDDLETGQITETEFYNALRTYCPDNISDLQLKDAWNSILLDFPIRRLQILQQLQLHYDLFLCSNTNAIHEEAFNRILQQTCGYPSLALFFDKVYLSHRVGLRKPDPAIFKRILDENGLLAKHTLFLDDSLQHIEAAASLGIQTLWVTDGITMEKDIFKPRN